MKLTGKQSVSIVRLSEFFKCDPETLIHAMLDYELEYLERIRTMSVVERQIVKKYEIAKRYKLLD